MLSESSVSQFFRISPHLVERPQSPSIVNAQPIPTKSIRPSPLNSIPDEHQISPILAPSPKKMVYRSGSVSSDVDDMSPWGLPTLSDDSDEDSYDGDSISDHLEDTESTRTTSRT
ncbi:hypothetical protein K7432_005153 [Basidiobolus ranarum]|uniref:Uncharacterized protein n=1 Tax=Basidiobolus ranarum TaxID=34480 RepID=A0ABR2WX63_9FUNG